MKKKIKKKEKEEVTMEPIKITRQLQIQKPNLTLIISTEDPVETLEYVSKKMMKLLKDVDGPNDGPGYT